jgi:hypothetical protein
MGRECDMPQQVVGSLNSLFEDSLLPFGALQHVVSNNWTLPIEEVPGLLDQFGWKDNAKREHMQLLLCMVLRAVNDLRSELQHALALGSAVEIEGRLSRAQQRAHTETQRAFRKHGHALPKGSVPDVLKRLDSLVHTLSAPCVSRIHETRIFAALGDISLEESAAPPSASAAIAPPPIDAVAAPAGAAGDPVEADREDDTVPRDVDAAPSVTPSETADEVVARARGLIASMLAGIDVHVVIIGSALLYTGEDIDILITTEHGEPTLAAVGAHLALVTHDPPTLRGQVDGLHLEVQVLPTETIDPRLLRRKAAVTFWEEMVRFTAVHPAAVPYI